MGTLIILIAGILGAASASKKTFLACWCNLVFIAFALYCAVFLAPIVINMIEVKSLDIGYKIAVSFAAVFLVLLVALKKSASQIFPDFTTRLPLPPIVTKLGPACLGFLNGMLIISIIIFCLMRLPVVKQFPIPESLDKSSSSAILSAVGFINRFSFQSATGESDRALKILRLIPDPEREKAEQLATEQAELKAQTQEVKLEPDTKAQTQKVKLEPVSQKTEPEATESVPVSSPEQDPTAAGESDTQEIDGNVFQD